MNLTYKKLEKSIVYIFIIVTSALALSFYRFTHGHDALEILQTD